MNQIIMLVMLLIVIATSLGVFFWFSARLRKIEEELWGKQRLDAEKTANNNMPDTIE
jgi:flagellar basal body-associated protein FliL